MSSITGKKKLIRHTYITKTILAHPRKRTVVSAAEFAAMQDLLLVLQELSQNLVSQVNLEEILGGIMKTLGQALQSVWVNIWELTPDGKAAYIKQGYGKKPHTDAYIEHSRRHPLKLGTAWIGRALATKKPWGTSDLFKDPHLPRSWVKPVKAAGFHAILCVPQIVESAKVIGGMCVYFDRPKVFTDFEMRLVTVASNQAATAILNAKIFSDLLVERNKTLAMIQSLNEGVILYDIDDRVTLMNTKAEELLLVSSRDILGREITEAMAAKSQFWQNAYNISHLSQTEYQTNEYITEGPNKVVLEVTAIPVRDAERRKIGAMQILRDITREKEIELLKSGFIATASHQLRTPMTGIRWALHHFLTGEVGVLNPEQHQLAEDVYKTITHLVQLLNDLLNVSRMEEGRFGYAFKIQPLLPIVKKVLADADIALRERNLAIVFADPTGLLPDVSVDGDVIAMAIRNILDNAIRYSVAGRKIFLRLNPGEKNLILSIEDEGIGIPADERKFIFVKFYRAKNATRFRTDGSGLGLYIARSIIEKHNGRLTFESTENKGSTFYLSLPVESKAMPKERRASGIAPARSVDVSAPA